MPAQVADNYYLSDIAEYELMRYLTLLGDIAPFAKLIAYEMLGDSWREDAPVASVSRVR